jgi:uncharacterized protein (DUF305 family)
VLSRRNLLVGGVTGLVGVGVGVVVPVDIASAGGPTAADIGFCTDMAAHHVQALAMCQRVLGRDTGDPVQAAASEVLQNQAIEVGMMRAWLTDWGESTATPTEVMAWMHGGLSRPLEAMHGYAGAAELQELSSATGRARGRIWLELMRAHHLGGVTMAEAAVELASEPKVVRLARTQAATQTFEIEQYDLLLAGEYAAV